MKLAREEKVRAVWNGKEDNNLQVCLGKGSIDNRLISNKCRPLGKLW